MTDYLVVEDLQQTLIAKLLPMVTVWNRLEGRPRTADFNRALQARIRDPLWMISKQWQMGEFEGDDAGSPVSAKLWMHSNRLHKYRAGAHSAQEFESDVPLETKVEQRTIPLENSEGPMSLDLRLMLGRRWMKMITALPPTVREQFLSNYAFELPDPDNRADAFQVAHSDTWQKLSACAGRLMDGGALYLHLAGDPTHTAADGIIGLTAAETTTLEQAGERLRTWFRGLLYQPTDSQNNAWQPSHLEYQFDCSSPVEGDDEKVFTAEEYYHGRLDWYNLDIDPAQTALGDVDGAPPVPSATDTIASMLPAPLIFNGMPNSRWWEFEDRKTSLGFIDPATTDLNKLLVIEFGLVYANDWFLVPVTLPVGSVTEVRGLTVTNVFGERTWVEAAGRGQDDDWQRWNMYGISVAGNDQAQADNSLLLLPTVPKIQESEAVEEIVMVRDEMANMAWAIETRVPLPSGRTRPGGEVGRDLLRFHRRHVLNNSAATPVTELENDARIRYEVMNSVPENWIPFVPTHLPGSSREVQLQRAAMPRVIQDDPELPVKVRPRTFLMREGLDVTVGDPLAYYLHEEEVTRAGTRVKSSFQRTRWQRGEVFNWFGVRKHVGRGEASSALAFDQIVPKE